jgi:hypothetical protein
MIIILAILSLIVQIISYFANAPTNYDYSRSSLLEFNAKKVAYHSKKRVLCTIIPFGGIVLFYDWFKTLR